MRVRNGYWLVGRAGRWSGGLKAVRAGARRGEAAPVVCGGSGVSSGGWYPMPGREYTGAGRGAATGRAEARCTAPAPFIVRSSYNNAALSERWVQMPAAYPRAMAQVHLRWEKNV